MYDDARQGRDPLRAQVRPAPLPAPDPHRRRRRGASQWRLRPTSRAATCPRANVASQLRGAIARDKGAGRAFLAAFVCALLGAHGAAAGSPCPAAEDVEALQAKVAAARERSRIARSSSCRRRRASWPPPSRKRTRRATASRSSAPCWRAARSGRRGWPAEVSRHPAPLGDREAAPAPCPRRARCPPGRDLRERRAEHRQRDPRLRATSTSWRPAPNTWSGSSSPTPTWPTRRPGARHGHRRAGAGRRAEGEGRRLQRPPRRRPHRNRRGARRRRSGSRRARSRSPPRGRPRWRR